jgi:hypothetical protein
VGEAVRRRVDPRQGQHLHLGQRVLVEGRDPKRSNSFAGYSDWRVPNAKELASITNLQTFNPAVTSAFNSSCSASCTVTTCSCTKSVLHWTSTTFVSSTDTAFVVDFTYGDIPGSSFKSFSSHAVRAVRN